MKIYTKTGDDGSTGMIGGKRTSKGDLRIECYGTVDELNAIIGWAAVVGGAEYAALLRPIQNELFVIGSHLATPDDASKKASDQLPAFDQKMIQRLETEIDAADAQIAPLRQFILPGGCELAARLHIARTVCRRAERLTVTLASDHAVPGQIVTYLNRLSDWLFVHARLANHEVGSADIPWQK